MVICFLSLLDLLPIFTVCSDFFYFFKIPQTIFTREDALLYFTVILFPIFSLNFYANPLVLRSFYAPPQRHFFLISGVISLLLSLIEDKMLYITKCCL